jgi:ADP-ribose pyrophosphatase YjhB (NUDIX family)
MYKVFVNNKPVFFISEEELPAAPDAGDLILRFNRNPDLDEILKTDFSTGNFKRFYIVTRSAEEAMHHFLTSFKIIHAAGGIVINEQEQLLIIFRNGVWDLPKGKMEHNESPQDSAMREVCEETGICNLVITGFAEETWHSYYLNSTATMKHTTWFRMKASGKNEFRLQKSEGIELAKWVGREEAGQLLSAAYPSIAELIQKHFLNNY